MAWPSPLTSSGGLGPRYLPEAWSAGGYFIPLHAVFIGFFSWKGWGAGWNLGYLRHAKQRRESTVQESRSQLNSSLPLHQRSARVRQAHAPDQTPNDEGIYFNTNPAPV